jgi:hypothetical protein
MNGGRRINVREHALVGFALVQRVSSVLHSAAKSDGQVKKASQDDHDLLISSFEDFFPPGLINADPETKANAAASTKADRRDAYILVSGLTPIGCIWIWPRER